MVKRISKLLQRCVSSATATTPTVSTTTIIAAPTSLRKKIKSSRSIDMPTLYHEGKSTRAIDGNTAAAHVAYAMSDVCCIYPISPSTSMGETVDKHADNERKNVFGQKVRVHQMQSEMGSAGALHGALSGGALCSTFTASQGLLLMIPNMYLCAGELLPAVFHVSARALARQSLSIFCDHSDVMAVRSTGVALLCAHNPQQVMDLAVVSHLAAIKSSVPFVHFFDGTRTSSVIECVDPVAYSTMKSLMPWDQLADFRSRGLNPQHPIMRGMGQDPQIYYQSAVAANKFYDALPQIVQDTMDEVAQVTGRQYKLFDYYGDKNAERAIVIMGSAAKTAEETVDYLRKKGEKVGVLKVHLFRPFSIEHFLAELPASVKAIAVLDRTKEDLAPSLPLHADVLTALSLGGVFDKKVVGGNYGLGSKEFAPKHVKAVFDNLLEKLPKAHFTVGINDDVTHTSLPVGPTINTIVPGTTQAVFFGLGSDGTVGANKQAAAIIGERTEFFSQGHFNYSSQKAGASTVSHLRFGPKPIRSEYEIEDGGADYVACHNTSYLAKFDMLSKVKEGGTFVVNCPASDVKGLEDVFPAFLRRQIAAKKVTLYTIDAHAVAVSVGLPPKRINQVMQATFFNLTDILPEEDAKMQLEAAIDRLYGKKSPDIVRNNKKALAAASENLNTIEYPASWINAEDNEASLKTLNPSATKYSKPIDEFSSVFLKGIDSRSGDELAVSAFLAGGESPIGQSSYQKRALADAVPVWIPDNCTQCNLCAVVCPHAVVRPFLLDKKEMEVAPEGLIARKAKGGGLGGLNYTLQLAPYDCTGCQVCVEMCPDDALVMKPQQFSMDNFNDHWEYSLNHVKLKDDLMDKTSVKGSQFQLPLMEFSGACSGCGETAYVKLLTQMFGERMVIANSSGCSSVWGGSYGMSPFIKNEKGQGPAWARSLFEDAAEYGFGMALSSVQRRKRMIGDVEELMEEVDAGTETISKELKIILNRWLDVKDDAEKCNVLQPEIKRLLAAEPEDAEGLKPVRRGTDMLVAPSHWIIGGDGWAYDIGFGGLDHVMASGENINILVLDTEGYSNTGAQISKATPKGATMKMAAGGNSARKKDLGAIAMMHENTYVASVSLAADVNQTVKAFKEAEAYKGPSIIIAYATCVDWGHRLGDKAMVLQQVQAVDSGYWPMYRYNPDLVGKSEANGFELDAKRIDDTAMESFLGNENRFTSLRRSAPEHAKMLQDSMHQEVKYRHETRKRRAMGDEDLLEYLKKSMGESVTTERVTVLYGSDTGNSEVVAKNFQFEFKRRGMKAKCIAFNDFSISDLPDESKVLAIVATAGQGEMPKTAVKFWQEMETFLETAPPDYLKDTKFAVFGMGDSSYVFFNEAAKKIDGAFEKLGGERIMGVGLGDDQHPARFDTELDEWSPDFYDNIEAPEPPQELSAPSHLVEILSPDHAKAEMAKEPFIPDGSKPVKLSVKRSTVPEGYERAIDHFEFDLTGSGLSYEQGDSLALWPSNSKAQVDICLEALGVNGDEIFHIQPIDSNRSVPLPEVITAHTLLTEVLDIGGWPKRRFYEMLKLSVTDPKEKEVLQHLCTKEGKSEYVAYAEESYTYGELLQKFPSAKVSIGTLLDYVPDIKARLYSIASSSRMRGDDECHLCVIKNEWTGTSGRNITGLSTRWLADDLNPDQGAIALQGGIHPSAVTMPDTHKTPILMVALGTGIAPMRAFIEERACAKKDGEECAPMALFFGARNRQEYSYEAEFDQYQKDGVLEHIHLALSREQKEKIYVTHRLQQQKQLVYDLIHEGHGNLYLCGPGGNVPPQVRLSVIDAIQDCGGHSKEYAEKYVEEMQINGRYNVEAW